MGTGYVAFGLSLDSSFSLPGMVPAEARGLPRVALKFAAPGELGATASGAGRSSPWRGRLGDGEEFTIERGPGGDLLFAYGERARYRFDRSASLLECAPRDASELDWQRVLLGRVLPNLSLAYGREALHASAVESPLGVVAIAAPSGTGKSTLAAELMHRGWPLFSDDVLVLAAGPDGVEAHPGTPHVNIGSERGGRNLPPRGVTLGVHAGERWMAIGDASPGPRRVAALCLLERGRGLALEATPLPASPLVVAPYMLGLPDERGCEADREADRFDLYSDLTATAAIVRLSGGPADGPAALADSIETALDRAVRSPVQGAAA